MTPWQKKRSRPAFTVMNSSVRHDLKTQDNTTTAQANTQQASDPGVTSGLGFKECRDSTDLTAKDRAAADVALSPCCCSLNGIAGVAFIAWFSNRHVSGMSVGLHE